MIAVIIPTLNEGKTIHPLLVTLSNHEYPIEIIIVDGGSDDDTIPLVESFKDIKLIHSEKGRAHQMHRGALSAKSEYLFFLHADTYPPKGFEKMIMKGMKDRKNAGGSFTMKFDHPHPFLKLYGLFTRINHLLFTYGDQGLFLRKALYLKLGGFKTMPLMEDIEFQKRIRNSGRFIKIRKPVITSARRYEKNGVIRQQFKNNLLVVMYHLGWSAETLNRYY